MDIDIHNYGTFVIMPKSDTKKYTIASIGKMLSPNDPSQISRFEPDRTKATKIEQCTTLVDVISKSEKVIVLYTDQDDAAKDPIVMLQLSLATYLEKEIRFQQISKGGHCHD